MSWKTKKKRRNRKIDSTQNSKVNSHNIAIQSDPNVAHNVQKKWVEKKKQYNKNTRFNHSIINTFK